MNNIKHELSELTDAQLLSAVAQVKEDLFEAASNSPNSDWHGACFAAAVLYAEEMERRGLRAGVWH